MMKEAVEQDEIKSLFHRCLKCAYVLNHKISTVLSTRIVDIPRIDIESCVVCFFEVAAIGTRTTSNVENALYLGKVIVMQYGRKLCIGKRSLPKSVGGRVLHQTAHFLEYLNRSPAGYRPMALFQTLTS